MNRPNWKQYFMNLAKEVAKRSTCDRKHVGSVIVKNKTILSTGYNGSMRGVPHCSGPALYVECNSCGYIEEFDDIVEASSRFCCKACSKLGTIKIKRSVGHVLDKQDHCISVVHSEINAIAQAARNGVAIDEAEIYVTASPCWNCFKTLVNAGIERVYYNEFYKDDRIFEAAKSLVIPLIQVELE